MEIQFIDWDNSRALILRSDKNAAYFSIGESPDVVIKRDTLRKLIGQLLRIQSELKEEDSNG